MARVSLVLTVLASYLRFISGQSACTPPNGGDGTCMLLDQCPLALEIIKKTPKTQQVLELLKQYHCGLEGTTPKVCCPNICKTPDNQDGQCVSIVSCPSLARLMEPPLLQRNEIHVLLSRCKSSLEYSVCCPLEAPKTAVPKVDCSAIDGNFPPDPRTGCCGVDTVKGTDQASLIRTKVSARTTVDQYPWMVIMEYVKDDKIKTLCIGALISRRYLLTTAHCVIGEILKVGTPVSVRLGEYDTINEGPDCATDKSGVERCTDGMVRIAIEKTIPHPDHKPFRAAAPHDVALVKLQHDAPFTDFIRPICLPNNDVTVDPPVNMTFYAAGWGKSLLNSSSNVKLQVDLPFVPKDLCQSSYAVRPRIANITSGQICAGGISGKDTCKGDTGGPLMYHNGNNFEAVGITSFGPVPCGLKGVPAVYTHVFKYIPWIMRTINIDVTLG